MASAEIGKRLGYEDVIAFAMGGTTAKSGVIYKGKPLTTGSALIGGYDRALPIQVSMMDIFEVGTGGGSIAAIVPVADPALSSRTVQPDLQCARGRKSFCSAVCSIVGSAWSV